LSSAHSGSFKQTKLGTTRRYVHVDKKSLIEKIKKAKKY